jgi:DNA modification methylase
VIKRGLYNSDFLAVVKEIESESIDLIIADPPYFEITKESWDNQWDSFEDYETWLLGIFKEFQRVIKIGGACYVYSAISHYPRVQLALNKHLDYAFTITWKKQRSRGKGWGFNREEICVNTKGNHLFKKVESSTLNLPHLRKGKFDYSNGRKIERKRNFKLASSIWDDVPQVCSSRKQLTPTEKPVELARRMIKASAPKRGLVLIPFAGSGSEIEACVIEGRGFIAVEKDKETFEIAMRRYEEKKAGLV